MKRHSIPAIGAAMLLASCSQPAPQGAAHLGAAPGFAAPKEAANSRQYLALPGQPARAVAPTDTDAAFERQAAAYAVGTAAPAEAANAPLPDAPFTPFPGALPAAPAEASDAAMGGSAGLAAGNMPEPQPLRDPAAEQSAPAVVPAAPAAPAAPAVAAPAAEPQASYAVQVNNGTMGRLYVEMQDDAGNIFPVAFMHANQTISTPPQEPKPIVGKLTVVIRDPDQPGAPELRRYKVTPPADYMGKTIGVTILPGGQYRASLDGEVYYVSPAPTPPGQH